MEIIYFKRAITYRTKVWGTQTELKALTHTSQDGFGSFSGACESLEMQAFSMASVPKCPSNHSKLDSPWPPHCGKMCSVPLPERNCDPYIMVMSSGL